MKNKKGFTLIELIAVLVILAILALIATPLVLNVVKNAKDAANKRSVDAYGKSIDLAITSYLLDKGDFPASINDLTIEYSGSEVVCGVAQLNEDSSVYLSECTVGGKAVKDSSNEDGWYHYGKTDKVIPKAYKIGDEVTYNGMNFYVIADSDENSDTVTMLKADPIKVEEVNYSGTEIESNISNTMSKYNDGYIHIQYLYKDTCVSSNDAAYCVTDYKVSSIKQLVDAWASNNFKTTDLKEDATGYSTRLITLDELINNLGYSHSDKAVSYYFLNQDYVPSWVYGKNTYWTMTPFEDLTSYIWTVDQYGGLYTPASLDSGGNRDGDHNNYSAEHVIRPVVTVSKTAL